ncbi:hypothetical protein BLA60_29780 [Actinophytocola xinjiangensis]|uniref:HTH luxR-type domain-containing protein n=1 Tax=Actinophytocola xinjiangensis TaxID=485602 RepID=A0A7Z1AWN8_9PSEU|nr:hypothetical protein BLA60_29780 [Actinophytocola xinjiangensis]
MAEAVADTSATRLVRERVEEAVASRGRALILVRGGLGTGKSTVLNSALSTLREDGEGAPTVVRVRCVEDSAKQPFWLARAVVKALGLTGPGAQNSPLLDSGGNTIRPALWAVADRTGRRFSRVGRGTQGDANSEPVTARMPTTEYTVLSGLSKLAGNVMATGPFVLAIDDLQWCDEQSLRLLDYLLRRARNEPLIVLATVRTPAPEAVLGVAGDHLGADYGTMVALGPVDLDGIRAMVAIGTGSEPGPEFVEVCRLITGGHRSSLGHLVAAVVEAGLTPDDEAVGKLHHVAMGVIEEFVATSFAGQPQHVHHVVRAVAVLASTDIDLVCALSGVPVRGVRESLEFLRDHHFLDENGSDFRHELVRAALLRAAPDDEVSWMRDRAARLLNDAGVPAEVVASQLLPLGVAPEPWMQNVLREAARDASSRGAPKVALRHLSPLINQSPGDVGLREQVAGILVKFNPKEAVDHLRAALDLTTDFRARAELAIEFGHCLVAVQDAAAGVDLLLSATDELYEAIAGEADAPAAEASEPLAGAPAAYDSELCKRLEATVMFVGANHRSTLATVRERLATVPEPGEDTPADRYLMSMFALERTIAGSEPERAVAFARAALPLEPEVYDTPATMAASFVFTLADQCPQALAALDVVVASNTADGALWSLCRLLGQRAQVRLSAGDLAGAVADARLSIELAQGENWPVTSMVPSLLVLAQALIPLGELDEARTVLESVTGPELADSPFELHSRTLVEAKVLAATGDRGAAVKRLQQCGRGLEQDGVTNPLFLPWWAEATLLLAERGRAQVAMPLVECGEDLVSRWDVPRARALSRTARAMVCDGTERIDLLSDAAAAMESSAALLDRQRVAYLLGRELLRREDLKPAREHLRTAAELATLCGATAAAVESRALLVSAGGRMRQVTGARTDVLTRSELRVSELAVGGASNREIAEELFVTSRTVEVHLTNVYRKLGLAGRADLPAAMRKLGGPSPRD